MENNKNVSTFESWLFFLIRYAVRRIFLLNIRSLHVKQIHVVVKYTCDETTYISGECLSMRTVSADSSKTSIESINLAYFSNFCFKKISILLSFPAYHVMVIAIYAPMIYTAPCIVSWMCVYLIRGQVGGGWAMDIESFLDPVKWH